MRGSVALVAALGLLTSCGDGPSSGGVSQTPPATQPPTVTQPPAFISAATASTPENGTGVVYQAAASSPQGKALTYSISGGADRALFQISASGALSFVAAPDFEAPDDADRNNVYEVQLAVSDGAQSATLSLAITVTNVGPDGIFPSKISNQSGVIALAPVPDATGRYFEVASEGYIVLKTPTTMPGSVFLNLAFSEYFYAPIVGPKSMGDPLRGLRGMVAAPDFTSSGVFYVSLFNTAGNLEVRRYKTIPGDRDRGDEASGDVILSIPFPANAPQLAKGGWIGFGPDGYLYMLVGDGSSDDEVSTAAQNPNSLLGKVLRIDVSKDAFPGDANRDYAIPASNPFATAGGAPEVWGLGVRDPSGGSFDPVTRWFWFADSSVRHSEIDAMRPEDGGANFGYPALEGTAPFKGTAMSSMLAPVAEYLGGTGPRQGYGATGGFVYRGPIEALRGNYVFGDRSTQAGDMRVWSFPLKYVKLGSTISSDRFFDQSQTFLAQNIEYREQIPHGVLAYMINGDDAFISHWNGTTRIRVDN